MKAKRRLLLTGIIIGSLLTLSPAIGLLDTVFGMTRAFATLAIQASLIPMRFPKA